MNTHFTRSLLLVLAGLVSVHADSLIFSWTPATSRLAGSSFTLWQLQGSSLAWSHGWQSTDTNLVFDTANLQPGMNHFCVTQISTNAAGIASVTPLSGEVQVIQNPAVALSIPILTSTNLGKDWTGITTQTIIFPSLDAQRFFLAGQIRAARTNQIILPPSP